MARTPRASAAVTDPAGFDPVDSDSAAPRRRGAGLWLLLLVVLGIGGWRGWLWWQAERNAAQADATASEARVLALEERLAALRRDQRSQVARLQQADATNRVLRDELLGISQRAALLEDSLSKLADPDRHGAQALRLDEVELLLVMAQRRLQLGGDLDAARRALALAAGVLDGIHDPAYLSLRQTLAQERAALDALEADPARTAGERLAAFEAALVRLPTAATGGEGQSAPWWQRVFSRFVEVRRSEGAPPRSETDRSAGLDALRIELTLARAALERRDPEAWGNALDRVEAWLTRLWPDSPALRTRRQDLRALRALPLRPMLPVLGSTLEQLRSLRAAG
jgi:uroporphyrin-3 C-methyltransferase